MGVPFDHIDKFDKKLLALVGKKLDKVLYYEIDQDEPFYDQNKYHSIDFGVELYLIGKELFHITWVEHDYHKLFNIQFYDGSIGKVVNLEKGSRVVVYDVSQDNKWTNILHSKIIEVKSYWGWSEQHGDSERHYYPKDISLRFDNEEIVYFSCTSTENDETWSAADEISIFFDPTIAKSYGVGIIDYLRVLRT